MKKIILLPLALLAMVFLSAASFPEVDFPTWWAPVVTIVVIPLIAEAVRYIAVKWIKLSWVDSKPAMTTIAFVLSLGAVMVFLNWKDLPPLPGDAMQAALMFVGYATSILGLATAEYNVIYNALLDRWAKPGGWLAGLLGYRVVPK